MIREIHFSIFSERNAFSRLFSCCFVTENLFSHLREKLFSRENPILFSLSQIRTCLPLNSFAAKPSQLVRIRMAASQEVVDLSDAGSAPNAQRKQGGRPQGYQWEDFDADYSRGRNNPKACCKHCKNWLCGKKENNLTHHIFSCEPAPQERKDWYKAQSDLKRANNPSLVDDLPVPELPDCEGPDVDLSAWIDNVVM